MSILTGKIAVISGGTSGIGLAIAKRFVAEGAHVFIFGRRQAQLDQAVNVIGRNVTALQADAANLDDLDRVAAAVRRASRWNSTSWAPSCPAARTPAAARIWWRTPAG